MPRQYRYTIVLHPEPEDGGDSVTVPALPGCYSLGDTLEEAIANTREAIHCHIEGLLADGEPVSEEPAPPQVVTIDVAA